MVWHGATVALPQDNNNHSNVAFWREGSVYCVLLFVFCIFWRTSQSGKKFSLFAVRVYFNNYARCSAY